MQRRHKLTKTLLVSALMGGVMPVIPASLPVIGVSQAEAAVASRIEVRGNTRIEASTVESYLTISRGRRYGPADVDESLKTLFATGLFEDVKISQQGGTLVVTVVENPMVNRISFEGNKRLSDKTLEGVVRTQERSMLTRAKVQSDVQNVLEAYRRSGRYRATVEPKIISRSNNRVDLVFEINEGDRTGIERITFIGNTKFSDGRLRDVVRTRQSGLLSFLRTTDNFDPDRLDADQELLRQFYYRHGYADFRIVSAVADLDREENVFYVTFTVEEGEQYTYGDIDLQTTLQDVDPEELRRKLRTDPGDTYSSLEVEKSLEDLTLDVSRQGYAFAQIRPRAERDYENRTISLTYYIEEGPRVYVERINVRGNDRTREYVIRREFDLAEGDAFNRVLIDKAERRLKDLQFFKDVRITTERGSSPDKIIVNVDVVEQPTGEVGFGVGYSTSDGVIGDVTIQEKNFLGRGQFVRARIAGGTSTQSYEFAFTEPYFLGRRISLSLDAYRRAYEKNDYRNYDLTTTGGSIGFGLPLRDDELRLNLVYRVFDQDLQQKNTSLSNGLMSSLGHNLTSAIGYSLVYDTRDSRTNPRDGFYASFGQEFAGLGGDSRYISTTVDARAYKELLPEWGVIGIARLGGGYITGIGGKSLRASEQFQHNDVWLRGFEPQGIGPRDSTTGDALGGRWYMHANLEAEFPIFGLPKELGLSGAVFTDFGSVWNTDPAIANCVVVANGCGGSQPAGQVLSDGFDPRLSAGFGVKWASPFGPLRADFAWPIIKQTGDRTQVFRIGGGTRF
ncbi:MAG: outer membrane protein assembly factor BamA [Stappia sp.]|uniref:outer membrane protein assembly factor BamA n=1 Tax=Stappia sp. TaxID=1870903 RepID=UPI000C501A44|nr:outer membrane protein assembly factor BamA [Stappia sp.]MAA98071.1 outer membrane protein assembly factor BamA [Stappia sp.]MBM21779.1 outer membrane protein assembly factor BamA [Stappia sp.]